jgi:RNA polymerase sigma factor (sigma-70 family)
VTRRLASTRRRADNQGSLSAVVDSRFEKAPGHDGTLDVAQLVRRAAAGDRGAWEGLVDQYSRLIWAMTREFKLAESDAADVVQATWLRILEHINRIEYPERIGSWLATTARHECLRHLAAKKRVTLVQDDDAFSGAVDHQPDVDERLLADERAQAVRAALSTLPSRSQRLLELLMADPPASYIEISAQLGLPIGSIGPTRGRCLERLRLALRPAEQALLLAAQRISIDPLATGSRHLGVGGADLSAKIGDKQHDRVGLARGQLRRAEDRDVCAGHPQALLRRRSVDDRRQQRAIQVRSAQQRYGTRRGPVAEHGPSAIALGAQPIPQASCLDLGNALQAAEHCWIENAGCGIIGEKGAHRVIWDALAASARLSREQDRAAVQVEGPRRPRLEACCRQHGRQRGGRVVRVMTVPQRVPLAVPDDGT